MNDVKFYMEDPISMLEGLWRLDFEEAMMATIMWPTDIVGLKNYPDDEKEDQQNRHPSFVPGTERGEKSNQEAQ